MKLIGRLICRFRGQHTWHRAKDYPVKASIDGAISYYERGKHCKYCGEYALVKRRPRKEKVTT